MRFTIGKILIAMVAVSVLLVGIVVPFLRRDYDWAMAHFRDASSNPHVRLSEFILVDAIGYEDGFDLIAATAKENPRFAIERDGRFAQFQSEICSSGETTDVVWVSRLDGVHTSFRWHGPAGMQIDKLSIDETGVKILAHGEFNVYGDNFRVEQRDPLSLTINWPTGTPPSAGNFFHQIHCQLHEDGGSQTDLIEAADPAW